MFGRPWAGRQRRSPLRRQGPRRGTPLRWPVGGLGRGDGRCGHASRAIFCTMPHDGRAPSNNAAQAANPMRIERLIPTPRTVLSYIDPADRVLVNEEMVLAERRKAPALFDLVGLGETGTPTARHRHKGRWAWDQAVEVRNLNNGNESRILAVKVALGTGSCSVWMAVFHDDDDMGKRLAAAFPWTRTGKHPTSRHSPNCVDTTDSCWGPDGGGQSTMRSLLTTTVMPEVPMKTASTGIEARVLPALTQAERGIRTNRTIASSMSTSVFL